MAATSYSLITLSFFLLISSAACFNITKILNTWPDYSTFNQYLTQTQLAAEINRRQTITVLAVGNDAMGSVSGQSQDVIKKIMSLHVILDYYDPTKLQNLSKKTALLTTLFQSSGLADNQIGFLNVSDVKGDVVFGSAMKGSSLDSKLVKSLAAQPYNISVLQITAPIVPNGIASAKTNTSSPPAPSSPPPSKAPAASPKKAPAPAPAARSPKSASAKAPAPSADAPAPADAPTADSPAADAPAPGPASPVADAADAPPPEKKNGATRVGYGFYVAVVMVGISSLVGL